MINNEKEYKLDFFSKNNFIRKKCKSCQRNFWTLDTNEEYCKSSPCVSYSFLEEKETNIQIDDIRERFLRFFEKRNHKIIEPRPVLARWREDIYLTIASIAVFQPFVTDGIIDPPANPLVFSQPCIRLKDLDLIGLTAGRHLTIFEMMAHHAFNYPNKKIYWKDETVEFCHELNTEIFKIDPYEISYIEDVWEGGGNAGPCFEVASKGLEIATLVFMSYKVKDGEYVPMPIYIVDTGYGLERYCWYLSKKPSAFHSIYGNLVDWLFKKLNIASKFIDDIVKEHAKNSILITEKTLKEKNKINEKISEKLGINKNEINEIINKIEASYTLLDHSKCLVFMLADGLVPSNTGEGYLGRLILRRALRFIKALNLDVDFKELIDYQIKLWGNNFKRIKDSKDRIKEIVEIEIEKFEETLNKTYPIISSLIENVKKGKTTINTETLVELYDSHGIHPDFIIQEANKQGIAIEYPYDFFSKIVEKHERIQKEKPKLELPEVKDIPPTKQLFYEDSYMKEFRGKIIKIIKPKWVILDQTAFYPEGGGQIYDTGMLIIDGKKYNVKSAYKVNDVILHEIDEIDESFIGKEVIGKIDWNRRIRIMRHHTATHVLLCSIRKVLGDHIWQAGANKEETKARLDVTHYKKITEEEIEEIEKLANEIVLQNVPVKAIFIERDKAESKFGYSLYQGGVMGGRIIRVVSVGDYDHQACGGTHVSNTGEIGLIKIIKVERIQDGVERFIYTAGDVTLNEYRKTENNFNFLSANLNVPKEKVVEATLRLLKELKIERKEVERLRQILAITLSENLRGSRIKIGQINVYEGIFNNLNNEDLIAISENIIKKDKYSVVLMASNFIKPIFVIMVGEEANKLGIKANELINILIKITKSGGGGKENLAQGGGGSFEKVNLAFSEIKEYLKSFFNK
jgi:alanyl-tRNA synthetase